MTLHDVSLIISRFAPDDSYEQQCRVCPYIWNAQRRGPSVIVDHNDKDPHLYFLKETVLDDKEQGVPLDPLSFDVVRDWIG